MALATGVLALAGCGGGGSSTAAGVTQPAARTTTTASASAAPSAAAASAATCPTAAQVSTAAGVTYTALQVAPPSSGFPQTACNYSGGNNEALTVGLYPAGTTLASLTSVATGTLTAVPGLGSQADSTTTPDSAVYVYRSSGACSVVDGSDSLKVSQVEAVAKVIVAG